MSTALKTDASNEPLVDTDKITKAATDTVKNVVASRVSDIKSTADTWGLGNLLKVIVDWIQTNFGFSLPGMEDTTSQAKTSTPTVPATPAADTTTAQTEAQKVAAGTSAGQGTNVNSVTPPAATPGGPIASPQRKK